MFTGACSLMLKNPAGKSFRLTTPETLSNFRWREVEKAAATDWVKTPKIQTDLRPRVW